MRPSPRALLLAAVLLAPLFPLAQAGTPTSAPWSPFDTKADVTAVAIAASGSTVSAATVKNTNLTTPSAPGLPCDPTTDPLGCISNTPTTPTASDLAIFDITKGFATNGTGGNAPLGRTFVAVSDDGKVVASLGRDAGTQPDTNGVKPDNPNGSGSLKLYYQYLTTGSSWTSGATSTVLTRYLTGNETDLLLSADGTRVVVAANSPTGFTVWAYRFDGSNLLQQFTFTQPGTLYRVAATSDLERLVVATQIPESGGQLHAALYSLSFTTGQLLGTLYDRTANGTAFVSAGVTPDGRLLAGDKAGHVEYANHSNDLQLISLPGVAAANVTPLAMSRDGSRVAIGSGSKLLALDTTGTPAVIWQASFQGVVQQLALNRTGGTIVAALNGTDGGIYAFGDSDANPLWKVPGAANGVAIDAEGDTVAYAQKTVVTAAHIPRSIVFEFPGGAKTTTPRPVKPLGSTTFELDVRNSGAGLERVAFVGPRDTDVAITPDPPILVVEPGESKKVILTATAGKSFGGRHSFNVTAQSFTSNATDDVTLSLQLQTATDVALMLNGSTDLTVAAGVRTDVLLSVQNNGSRDVAIGMRAVQAPSDGGEWSVTVDPSTFTLAPNTITTVRASVTAPDRTPNGTSDTVTFIMEGPDVADQVQVTFRINPTLGIDLAASGRVKFVEPGKIAWYNVTVTNTGSLPRTFQAFFQATPTGGKNWGVDMDTTDFRLGPGDARTIPVKVFAPSDATPNDRVSLFIVARTIPEAVGENVTQANLTLFANAIPPQPTTTTPTSNLIPGPGAALALGAITLISLALRNRRRSP